MANNRDIQDIRRANLRTIIDQRGSPTAVAKTLKISGPSWLSQLVHGSRPFTEKTARKFEPLLGLKVGYLDHDHAATAPGLINVDVPLVSQTLAAIDSLLKERQQTVSTAKYGALIDLAFSLSVKTGAVDRDFLRKMIDLLTME